ncbi:oocyte zinc finger protein XlCOF6-like [Lytechinus variegatus]|uniref:oocyte zinc finger protein XlCOF6-like n=1 Tax=Lytechinus variegatus TaxID=7654 RepID=UPI001BB0DA25|nr:oocyte zinc finger protein XlCOF6-like [Lytechinus variegatus]
MDVENLNDHTQSSEISSSCSSSDTDPNSPYPVENLQKSEQSIDKTSELQSLDVASTQTVQDQVGGCGASSPIRGNSPIPDRGNSPISDGRNSPTLDGGISPTPDKGKSPTPNKKTPPPDSFLAEGCESSPNQSSKGTASVSSESDNPCVEPRETDPEVLTESLSQDTMVQGQAAAYFGRKSVTSEDVVKYFAMPSMNNMKMTLGLGGAINLGCSPVLPKKGNTYERDYSCENHNTLPSDNSDDEDVDIVDDMEEADWSFDEEDDGAKPGKKCPCFFKTPAGSESGNKTPLQRQNSNLDAPGSSSLHSNPFYTMSSPVLHCPDCEQTFNCLVDLNRHRLKHVKEKSFKCTHCDKSFAFSFNLKSHERQHTGEKPYVCNKCGLSFVHAFDFHEHQRVHNGQGHFVCSICLKWFSHESKFLLHIRKHSSIKPFKCNMCGKSFHRAAGLRAHELLHSVQKEDKQLFPCQFCDRVFVRLSHKQMHERIHSGEKVFPCLHCGKTFTDLSTLKGHACTQTNGNQFKCNVCREEFLSLPLLASHSKVHATQKASTSRNTQVPSTKFNTFKRKGPLADAKRRFPCKLCSRVFSNKRLLDEHGKIHQREHTPFMCSECCMTFTHANYLKLHMTMHTKQDSTQREGQSAEKAHVNGKPSPLTVKSGSSSPLNMCRSRQSSGEQSASPSPVSVCPPIQIKAEPQ